MSWEMTPTLAVLWCLYPIGVLVLIELLLNDDDDNDKDGGVMSPVYQRY